MIIKIFGIALIAAFCAFILRGLGWRGAPLVAVGGILALLMMFGEYFAKITEIFATLGELRGMKSAVECILKVLGVGYLGGICSDICRELGEVGLSSVVQTLARIETLVIVSPMFYEVLRLGLELAQ